MGPGARYLHHTASSFLYLSHRRNKRILMPAFALPVLWRYGHLGLTDILDVYESDMPQHRFQASRVHDLIAVINNKLRLVSDHSYEVESVLLYGSKLSDDRLVEAIIPDLATNSPRLFATVREPFTSPPYCIVVIETLTGKKTPILLMPGDKVSAIKNNIHKVEGFPTESQVLAFNNERLEENRTLASYGIHSRHIIYLALKVNEPYAASDGSLLSQESSEAPKWRLINEGLNIEGKCSNRLCVAFGQMVIHPFLFESFNLVRESSIIVCPICHVQMKALTCGFYNCVWKFEGIRVRDGCSISSSWKNADDTKYHKFRADETADWAKWKSLLIVVKSRGASDAAKLVLPPTASKSPQDEVCTMCWSSLRFTSDTTAPCNHTFHRCCLDKWSKWCSRHHSLPSCPACRRSFEVVM